MMRKSILSIFVLLLALLKVRQLFSHNTTEGGVNSAADLEVCLPRRKPVIGGNWKLNPSSVGAAVKLSSELAALIPERSEVNVVIFPPLPLLPIVYQEIKNSSIQLGAQDMFYESNGAFTGAVSPDLLIDLGVSYVLIGHSERRSIFLEDDAIINKKLRKALALGLRPVLCIGESKADYVAGLNKEVCGAQLTKDLEGVTAEDMKQVVIAYEPIWAIGTGLVCPKEVAQEVHHFIRSFIGTKFGNEVASEVIIQYGGSVNPSNVDELMSMPDIDGCLVGGASLSAESFARIVAFQ